MSNSAFDPRHVAGDQTTLHPPPDSPVQELRRKIGVMSDCLSRMLDQCGNDPLRASELSYLNKQLTHLGNAYVSAAHILCGARMSAAIAEGGAADFDLDELRELTLPASDAQAEGGEA